MSLCLSLGLSLSLCCSCGRCLSRIVILDVMCMALFADMFFGVIGVDEALMPNKQVASRKGFGTDVANEGLLLGVCSDMALQMFLAQLKSVVELRNLGHLRRAGSTNLANSL